MNEDRVVHVGPPKRAGLPWLYAVAALLVSAAGVAVAWGVSAPLNVTVDGVVRTVPAGATIGDLAGRGYVLSKPGALLSVHGGVLRSTGGEPVVFTRDGVPAEEMQKLYDGDVVTSANGADRKENIETVRLKAPPPVTVLGSGPARTIVRHGTAGVDEVKRGVVSGSVISSRTVLAPVPTLEAATFPVLKRRFVALTFDDGPWPGQTSKILDILKAEGVHATFFMLGPQARSYPVLASRVASEGSEVANHTLGHRDLTTLNAQEIRDEVAGSAAEIKAATGVEPTFMRPPFGHVNRAVEQQVRVLGETIVLWNVDTQYWRDPGPAVILDNAKREMDDKSIVLMHDGDGDRTQTVQALPPLVDWLKAQGYVFVTVAEMEAMK